MNGINLDEYEIKKIVYPQEESFKADEMISYLLAILNNHSIPEIQKHQVRKQYEEIMKYKNTTMKPPTIILEKRK